jgi:hypothetical protein
MRDGWWWSKMGCVWEDIKHRTPQTVAGFLYGTVVYYFKRKTKHKDKGADG